jgi:hypothetical protein
MSKEDKNYNKNTENQTKTGSKGEKFAPKT